ncbi:MAG: hypothetical protein ACI4UE_04600 [Candidatus Scatovivens sp.]
MQDHGNVDKWIENKILDVEDLKIENIPFKETNMYVRKVLRDKKIYAKILETR